MASARALLPMAIGVAVIGGFAWVLLTRDWALGRWLALASGWSPTEPAAL